MTLDNDAHSQESSERRRNLGMDEEREPEPRKPKHVQSHSAWNPVSWVPFRPPTSRGAQVAFYAAVGAMAVAEVIEWPVAVVIGAGHLLLSARERQIERRAVQSPQ